MLKHVGMKIPETSKHIFSKAGDDGMHNMHNSIQDVGRNAYFHCSFPALLHRCSLFLYFLVNPTCFNYDVKKIITLVLGFFIMQTCRHDLCKPHLSLLLYA